MTEAIKLHIHVGSNIPGYLPEGDVFCTDDLSSAIESLRHELKDQQDYYYEGCKATSPEQQEKGSDCCAWCSVALDVEAALSAIADGDAQYITNSGGGVGWIFRTPEGPDMAHWMERPDSDRDSCDLNEDGE